MKAIWIFYCVPVWDPQVGGHLGFTIRHISMKLHQLLTSSTDFFAQLAKTC